MPNAKKDHWLSQFYLRNFAIPDYTRKADAEIWRTDLEAGTCSREKISDIAYGLEFIHMLTIAWKTSHMS